MEAFESKLVPILRDGVDVVKMILFKEMKRSMSESVPQRQPDEIVRLSAAAINRIFGTPNTDPSFLAFVEENKELVEAQIRAIPEEMEAMKIPLTDALRVQFLCDDQEGIDSKGILEQADALNILIKDRPVPLPKTFLNLIRTLGVAHGILASGTPAE